MAPAGRWRRRRERARAGHGDSSEDRRGAGSDPQGAIALQPVWWVQAGAYGPSRPARGEDLDSFPIPLVKMVCRVTADPEPPVDECCTPSMQGISVELWVEEANLDTVVVTLPRMDALTIHEAATTTGWSSRMLRYIERTGLVTAARSASGYRLYGPAELQRLRTLKELLTRYELGLSDVAFAARMAADPALQAGVGAWLEAEARPPEDLSAAEWLRFEQDKHQRLLAQDAA